MMQNVGSDPGPTNVFIGPNESCMEICECTIWDPSLSVKRGNALCYLLEYNLLKSLARAS